MENASHLTHCNLRINFQLWVIKFARVIRRESRFETGIVQGTIPSGFPVSWIVFLDVPGTATEQVRFCGFRRNSSSFDRAPKIRDSVPLNCLEIFLITLPSISSETWEMFFWAISGSRPFGDWLFLVFSGVTLETAASFFFFLKVAMILREKFRQQWRLKWFFIVPSDDLLYYEGKGFQ